LIPQTKTISIIAIVLSVVVLAIVVVSLLTGDKAEQDQALRKVLLVSYDEEEDEYVVAEISDRSSYEKLEILGNNRSRIVEKSVIRGKVVDRRGAELLGVEVCYRQCCLNQREVPDLSVFEGATKKNTDANGFFEIEVEEKVQYIVCAQKAGFAPGLKVTHSGDHITIVLSQSVGEYEGLVASQLSGAGIEQVKVVALCGEECLEQPWQAVAYTNIEGKFVLHAMPQSIDELRFENKNYETLRLHDVPSDETNKNTWNLQRRKSTAVNVKVLARESREILDDVLIDGKRSIADAIGFHVVYISNKINIDEQGDGVLFECNRYCPMRVSPNMFSNDTEVVMCRATRCTGRFYAGKGEPIENVNVSVDIPSLGQYVGLKCWIGVEEDTTDEFGRFELNDMPYQIPFDINAKNAGYPQKKFLNLIVDDLYFKDIGDFCLAEVFGTVTGIVVENGEPVGGAKVGVVRYTGEYLYDITDGDGRFEIKVDEFTSLFCRKTGYLPYKNLENIKIRSSESLEFFIVLTKAASISGKVVDSDGDCAPYALVNFTGCDDGIFGAQVTNEKGEFVVTGVRLNNEYYLRAFRERSLRMQTFQNEIKYYGGQKNVVLTVMDYGKIFGRVTDGSGTVATGDVVLILNDSSGFPVDNGYYSLALEEDKYKIRVICEGYEDVKREIYLQPGQTVEMNMVLNKK